MNAKKDKKPQNPTDKPSLRRILAEINKKYGKNTIGTITEMENVNIERIPTGIKVLDDVLGGGLPLGKMAEFFGIPGGGKSLISLLAIKQFQQKGLDCVYVDAENSFDPEFAKKLGVDIDKLVVTQVSVGEDVIDLIMELLKSEPGIVVIDSVAALITKAELAEPTEQAFMAPRARMLSKGLAKINAVNKKTLILWLNQLRSTMVMYGAPTQSSGGRALAHYVSLKLEVKQGDKIIGKNKDDIVGQIVQCRTTKNKVAQPYKQCSFKFIYDTCQIE